MENLLHTRTSAKFWDKAVNKTDNETCPLRKIRKKSQINNCQIWSVP